MINVEDFIIKEYSAGWSVDSPYIGKDKRGNDKLQHRQTYYPNLKQCLGKVRDVMAKDCKSVTELIGLLVDAEATDLKVLKANGLI